MGSLVVPPCFPLSLTPPVDPHQGWHSATVASTSHLPAPTLPPAGALGCWLSFLATLQGSSKVQNPGSVWDGGQLPVLGGLGGGGTLQARRFRGAGLGGQGRAGEAPGAVARIQGSVVFGTCWWGAEGLSWPNVVVHQGGW